MIKITDLKKIFNGPEGETRALDGVSLDIEKGEIFGVIGLSGAGKSTLIRTLNRLEEPTSGSIMIGGVDILSLDEKELNEKRKSIGMIFQHFNLLSSRDVFGNVAFPLELQGYSKNEIKLKVTRLLKLVGLEDKAKARISRLSGGQKQRVAIARALVNDPKVLLCDEATSALDPKTTQSILRLIRELKNQLDLTVVLITHQMEVINEICNKVAIIESGEIIEEGFVSEVFNNPREQTTKDFIAHLNISA